MTRTPRGAYCLVCGDDGPILVLDGSEIGAGARVEIEFSCGRCRRRWVWNAYRTTAGWVYDRAGAHQLRGAEETP